MNEIASKVTTIFANVVSFKSIINVTRSDWDSGILSQDDFPELTYLTNTKSNATVKVRAREVEVLNELAHHDSQSKDDDQAHGQQQQVPRRTLGSSNGCGVITNGYKLVFVNTMKRVLNYMLGLSIYFFTTGFYMPPFNKVDYDVAKIHEYTLRCPRKKLTFSFFDFFQGESDFEYFL